jgi:hypothetical protein
MTSTAGFTTRKDVYSFNSLFLQTRITIASEEDLKDLPAPDRAPDDNAMNNACSQEYNDGSLKESVHTL